MVKCPNDGCGEAMERLQVKDHVTKCPHTVISCKHKDIGCDTELKREDMAAHEQDDKLHLQVALETLHALKKEMKTLNALKEENQTMKKKGSITVAVTDFMEKKNTDGVYTSPPFYTHPHGYHMALVVFANGINKGKGTHITAGVEIVKGKHDAELKWPFAGVVTVTLLNQLKDEKHTEHIIKSNELVVGSYGLDMFISHAQLAFSPSQNTQYLKDDTLYFRVSVDVADHKPWLDCILK